MAKPDTIDAPELKPDSIKHHLNELKLNLLYDPLFWFNHVILFGRMESLVVITKFLMK